MITIVKPIPYLHTTAKNKTAYPNIDYKLQPTSENKENKACLPSATNIMSSEPLQDINFNHGRFAILMNGTNNFNSNNLFLFIVKTFQHLPKSPCKSSIQETAIYLDYPILSIETPVH